MIIFSGEKPALDNSKAVTNFNAPRNIALVKVSADLQTILSTGATEAGGFYTFGGSWKALENSGVVWLTDFTPPATHVAMDTWEAATRMKCARVKDDSIIIIYEVWSATAYLRTEYMGIDKDGAINVAKAVSPFDFRLTPTDEIHSNANGDIIFYSASASSKKVVRYVLMHNGGAMPEGNAGGGGFSGGGVKKSARSLEENTKLYTSASGIAFGIILLIVAIIILIVVVVFIILIAIIHGASQKAAAAAKESEASGTEAPPATLAEKASYYAERVANFMALFHPSADVASAGKARTATNESGESHVLWCVGAVVSTVLRLLLALAAFTMWIAASAALAKDGDAVHKEHGALQEPALGWAVMLLLLSLASALHDTVVLILQIPILVHYIARRMTPPSWLAALEKTIKWVIEMPHALCATQGLLLLVGVIVALGAGSVSQDTNDGYVYTLVLLYLTLPLRFAVALFALTKLLIVAVLPLTEQVASRSHDKARKAGSLAANMVVVGGEGDAKEPAIVTMATAKWDFPAGHPTELSFTKGDRIAVTNTETAEPGWYTGYVVGTKGKVGLFPFNRVVVDTAASASPPVPTHAI